MITLPHQEFSTLVQTVSTFVHLQWILLSVYRRFLQNADLIILLSCFHILSGLQGWAQSLSSASPWMLHVRTLSDTDFISYHCARISSSSGIVSMGFTTSESMFSCFLRTPESHLSEPVPESSDKVSTLYSSPFDHVHLHMLVFIALETLLCSLLSQWLFHITNT